MIKKLAAVLFLGYFVVSGETGTLTIHEAISESMKYFSAKLPAGMKVFVFNVESGSKRLSDYIIDESDIFIINHTKLSLADKSKLPGIMQEKGINDLNGTDEVLGLEIGKRIGAYGVIFGSISKLGGNYRFRVQALGTDGRLLGILSLNVKRDEILVDLLGRESDNNEFSGGSKNLNNSANDVRVIIVTDTVYVLDMSGSPSASSPYDARSNFNAVENRQVQVETPLETHKTNSGRIIVFSLRSEFLSGLSARGIGGTLELGSIGRNGFYFTFEGGGGAVYGGGGINLGGCFNRDGNVKNVLGLTMGRWNTNVYVDVSVNRNGSYYQSYSDYHEHSNLSFGGVFWKILFGKKGNLDVTNKLLFGYRDVCRDTGTYYGGNGGYGYYNSFYSDKQLFNLTHSLSVGYTLTKGR